MGLENTIGKMAVIIRGTSAKEFAVGMAFGRRELE
jgi:hypothetical protein